MQACWSASTPSACSSPWAPKRCSRPCRRWASVRCWCRAASKFFTSRLQERLGLDRTRANTLEIVDGKLTGRVLGEIVNADVKAQTLKAFCQDLGVSPHNAIAMGDGSNDLKMMAVAGLSVAFRAKPIVQAQADVAFNVVGLDGLLNLFPQQ